MGREVKRVDLRFNWYEKTVKSGKTTWFGYILDCAYPCQLCDNGKIKEETCPLCFGEKYTDVRIEPPAGEGWQMWETTTEGSPMSPVFKTPEELAHWLTTSDASAMGSQTATYNEWMSMIKQGWCPSGAIINGELMNGVEEAHKNKKVMRE